MADAARLSAFRIARTNDGTPGYLLENPFGQSVQVLPRPPAFKAEIVLEWEGAMPEEVATLLARARAVGLAVARPA